MPLSKDTPRLADNEVLAVREYVLEGAEPHKIVARIGIPRQVAGDRYECVAEIDEGDLVSSKPMNGADAMEALQLAIELIAAELKCIKDHSTGTLTWLEGKRSDLGGPP